MRSKVEYRRCGCGQLIGLRESCARCADKRRAELHAGGVAGSEQDEQRRRETRELWAKLDFSSELLKMPSLGTLRDGTPPYQRLEQLASEAAEQAHRLTGRVPYAVVTPQPEGDTVYWVMDGKAHQCHWVGGAERSVVMDGATSLRWWVVDGRVALWVDELTMYTPKLADRVRDANKQLGEMFKTGQLKIYSSSAFPESPAIGAEVAWGEAKADMMRRPDARYMCRNMGTAWQYAWGGGSLVCGAAGVTWSTSQMSDGTRESARWVRLV